jgi:hypothetical protein
MVGVGDQIEVRRVLRQMSKLMNMMSSAQNLSSILCICQTSSNMLFYSVVCFFTQSLGLSSHRVTTRFSQMCWQQLCNAVLCCSTIIFMKCCAPVHCANTMQHCSSTAQHGTRSTFDSVFNIKHCQDRFWPGASVSNCSFSVGTCKTPLV